MGGYDAHTTPWSLTDADFPAGGTAAEQARHLVAYAILAPSSHNSQPWRFRVSDDGVDVIADLDRWLQVADDDRRELHLSLGCAVENLALAAAHFGYEPEVSLLPDPADETLAARVHLGPKVSAPAGGLDDLFPAILRRRTNHREYSSAPLPAEFVTTIGHLLGGGDLRLEIRSDEVTRDALRHLSLAGDAINFANPAYRDELSMWLARGVFGESWIVAHMEAFAAAEVPATGSSVAKKDAKRIAGSPAMALIATGGDDRLSQLRAGRLFERVALAATTADVGVQPESQALEAPELRVQVARLMAPDGWVAQQLFRLGQASPEPRHTPRRSLDEVLVGA